MGSGGLFPNFSQMNLFSLEFVAPKPLLDKKYFFNTIKGVSLGNN